MAKMTPRTLSGFMELLPGPQQQMERIMEILRRTYSLYGFTPLDTPVIESSEVLLAKGGGETEKQIYRFTKGDSDLSLRFDLTVPLAKYVAQHYGELTFPFRRFLKGRYRTADGFFLRPCGLIHHRCRGIRRIGTAFQKRLLYFVHKADG